MSDPQSLNPYDPPRSDGALAQRPSPVPYEPRSRVAWSGWDVLIVLAQVVLWELIVQAVVRRLFPLAAPADAVEPGREQMQLQLLANSAASCAALVTGIVTLRFRWMERMAQAGLQILLPAAARASRQNNLIAGSTRCQYDCGTN